MAQDLDTINEIRDLIKIRITAYQQRIAKTYNINIKVRSFQVRHLVLINTFQNSKNIKDGKLEPKWERP